jgi:hypothetical protein
MNFNYKNASLEFDETKDVPTAINYSGDFLDILELKDILSLTYGMYGFQLNPDKDFPYQIQAAIWTAFGRRLNFEAIIPELPEGAIA